MVSVLHRSCTYISSESDEYDIYMQGEMKGSKKARASKEFLLTMLTKNKLIKHWPDSQTYARSL